MGIAIITDFGRDLYPGIMKSVIWNIDPKAIVVDITHDLPPQDIKTAAYITRASHRRLPNDSVILIVVDPGVGTTRRILVVKATAENYRYYFVAPDNGLLSVVFYYVKTLLKGDLEVYGLKLEHMSGKGISRTFHGRDLFAPLAAKVNLAVKGNRFEESIEELGLEPVDPIINENIDLKIGALGKLTVAFIDRFGDVVLNSLWRDPIMGLDKRDELLKHKALVVRSINGKFIVHPSSFYDPKKRMVATIGSWGLLEIARPYGNAARIIGSVDEVEIEPLK